MQALDGVVNIAQSFLSPEQGHASGGWLCVLERQQAKEKLRNEGEVVLFDDLCLDEET
jgi:hypothetical protein